MNYPSPAFDINGNLVTVDLPDGNYSNLPAGYYTTPNMAAVARGAANGGTPITSQQVGEIYSNSSPQAQAQVMSAYTNPPPASTYVAPTPPAAVGWIVPPPAAAPPTPQELIAKQYTDNGYVPPSAGDLNKIAAGEIAPPVTAPLTPAHTADPASVTTPIAVQSLANNVAPPPANTQTASQPSPAMDGIYADTAAFTVGHDAYSRAIMQLVDRGGNLVQWVPDAVQPFYVIAAPIVNEKRLIGVDLDGNPVFEMIDDGHNLLQWTENSSQSQVIVAPKYISTSGNASVITPSHTLRSTAGGASSDHTQKIVSAIPPASVTSLEKPVRVVGHTAAGWEIKQLVDAGGITKQWIEQAGAVVDLVNAPTYGVLFHTTATDAPASSTGTSVVSGGTNGPAPNTGGQNGTSGDRSRAQIQVGTTTAGFKIFQLVDAGGTVKQWILDPSGPNGGTIIDLVNAPTYGTLYRDSVIEAALTRAGGGTATETTAQKSSISPVFLAAIAVGVLFLMAREPRR